MASETVDLIGWSHPQPSWAVPPELHVLHGVNAGYKSQDLQQPGLEHASMGMAGQLTAFAATQGICAISAHLYKGKVAKTYTYNTNISWWLTLCECSVK